MNVLSCFDGMSCGRIALDRAGIKVDNYFSSEIDKHAIKVADDNWSEDTGNRLGDITKIKSNVLPAIDLLIGGSPCQSFSIAGNGSGFNGSSGLFWEFIRLVNEVKPKYFLLENVKMKKEWEQVITDALGVDPIEINSRLVSVQNRKRLYWTNITNVTLPEDRKLTKQDIGITETIGTITVKKDKSRVIVEREEIGCLTARYTDLNGSSRPMVIIDDSVIGTHFDSKKTGISQRMLTPNECEMLQTVPIDYTKSASDSQRRKMLGNGWTVDVIAHIFKGLNK